MELQSHLGKPPIKENSINRCSAGIDKRGQVVLCRIYVTFTVLPRAYPMRAKKAVTIVIVKIKAVVDWTAAVFNVIG